MDMTLYHASIPRGRLDFEASSRRRKPRRMYDHLDRQYPEHSPQIQVDKPEVNEKACHIVLHFSCPFFDIRLFCDVSARAARVRLLDASTSDEIRLAVWIVALKLATIGLSALSASSCRYTLLQLHVSSSPV